jgi:hypothetical protein
MMVSIVKRPAFQAKGDATGPPRKSDSKVSKGEEKKRHERRLSASIAMKQEPSDKKEEEDKKEREADAG